MPFRLANIAIGSTDDATWSKASLIVEAKLGEICRTGTKTPTLIWHRGQKRLATLHQGSFREAFPCKADLRYEVRSDFRVDGLPERENRVSEARAFSWLEGFVSLAHSVRLALFGYKFEQR